MPRTAKFEIFRGRDDDYYWRLKAKNGKILAHSEGYGEKSKALRAVGSALDAIDSAVIVEVEAGDDYVR